MFDWQNRTDRRAKKEVETTIQKDERRLAMPPKVEATIVVQKCPSSKKLLGVRIQKKEDGYWYSVWNFPLEEKRANHENYDENKIEELCISIRTTKVALSVDRKVLCSAVNAESSPAMRDSVPRFALGAEIR